MKHEDPQGAGRRLEVSGRSVARYLGLSSDAVQRAAAAGLLAEYDGVHDAAEVLELGRRPYVSPTDLNLFPPGSILHVQQAPARLDDDSEFDPWREAWGWSNTLSADEAVKSAIAWWPVPPTARTGVRAVVSTVSTFVVTIATVEDQTPVLRVRQDGRVHLNGSLATAETLQGRTLLRVFDGKRIPARRGSSFLLP